MQEVVEFTLARVIVYDDDVQLLMNSQWFWIWFQSKFNPDCASIQPIRIELNCPYLEAVVKAGLKSCQSRIGIETNPGLKIIDCGLRTALSGLAVSAIRHWDSLRVRCLFSLLGLVSACCIGSNRLLIDLFSILMTILRPHLFAFYLLALTHLHNWHGDNFLLFTFTLTLNMFFISRVCR